MKKHLYVLLAVLFTGRSFNYSSATVISPASLPAIMVPSTEPDSAAVNSAVADFKSLSKAEKKARVSEVRKELKAFKAAKKAGKEPSTNTLLLVILAILLPPLAVYLHEGQINSRFWISLILTLLFWIPGVIYALVVVLGS
ncbi:MAG: YqaE/Pmp3 family membrane protein [Chitinophagaceae bacterium]